MAGGPGFRGVLSNREFRGVTVAQLASENGDQAARIALAVLVFSRADSALYAALVFAVGYLFPVFGGALLSPLADRLPRRSLMLVCDASRAVLVGIMAIPSVPIVVLFLLLAAASLFTAPFGAARTALLPEILPEPPRYLAGMTFGRVINQFDQAIGLAVGGVVVSLVGPHGALVINAVAYLVSFVAISVAVRPRPSPAAGLVDRWSGLLGDVREGAGVVFRDPLLRWLMLTGWCAASFLIAPEGLAVAYAHSHGTGSVAAGLLTAAMPFGMTFGALALHRWVQPGRQVSLIMPLAMVATVPMMLTATHPPVWLAIALWVVSGAFQANIIPTIATFNLAVPAPLRGRAVGLASAGLGAGQGVLLGVTGALAGVTRPAYVIAGSALVGLALLFVLAARRPRRALRRAAASFGDEAPAQAADAEEEAASA